MAFDQRIKSVLIALLLCFLTTHLSAQQFFSTGTGSNNSFPLNTTTSNKVQWIYQPSDFSGGTPAPGNIVKVYFRSGTSTSNATFTNLTVRIGYTTATNTAAGPFATGLTTVFSATHTFPVITANDWFEIPLTTPFAYNFSQNIVVELSQSGYTSGVSLVQNSAGGNKRMWGGVSATTGSAGTGHANFGFDIQPAIPNNAGVFAIAEPVNFCVGTFPVKVTVMNNGNNTINDVQVHWTLDGVPQPSVNHTTPISVFGGPGGHTADVTLGNVTFSGSGRTIKAWTHLPNGVADPHNADDTLNTFHRSALNGVYTIGGASPDYPTVADAVTDLNNFGVCGPVTFNIRNGVYHEQGAIDDVAGASAINRIVFQSESGNAANVTIQYAGTGTADNYVIRLDGSKYVTLKNLTINATGATYARGIDMTGDASNDSIVNCVITGPVETTSSNNTAKIFADDATGSDNVIQNCSIINGSYGMYIYGVSATSLAEDWIIENNTVTNANNYSIYTRYMGSPKIRYNTITTNSTTTHYCIYSYYNDWALEIIGNKITATGTGTKYGIYQYYSESTVATPGLVTNNEIVIGSGTSTAQGIRSYYAINQHYYNNSVNVLSTSATGAIPGYFYYSSTTYVNNTIRNNVFANNGGGYAMYVYNPSYTSNSFDYNNLYTTGTKLVDQGTPATDYANLTTWRAAFGWDENSISYNPGFTSNTDLTPNPADSNSWSVNGRGVQIVGNDKDINGSPRATTLAAGVPDLGAYEFVPTALPPLATATPATPAAGTSQEFTFGESLVATIDWAPSSTVPSTIDVRQYSGELPPQLLAVSPSSYMYFYTDIDVPSGLYDYAAHINYMDPWLGTISSETNMKLVKKLGLGKWFAYNFGSSSTNTTTNVITAPTLIDHGYYSGIDNDIIFIAIINAEKQAICPNGSVTLTANPGTGISYKWLLDGNYIPGATSITYVATAAGDYQVEQTRGATIVVSEITTIAAVNPPPAVVTSNMSVICIGGSETLVANTGSGLTYQWKLFGIDIPGATNGTYEATTGGAYTVEVSNPGCSSISQPVSLSAIPLPMAVIAPDTNVILCNKGAVSLNANVPSTGLNLGFQWQKNSIDIPGATAPTFLTASPGSYTVVVSSGSCPATISPGTHLITGNTPKPMITRKTEGAHLYLSTGTYRSYQWFKDGVPIKGANNFAYVVTENGDYSVEVSNGFCTGLSEPYNLRSVGVDDLNEKEKLVIHPNPANNIINISAERAVSAVLTTMEGKVVFTGKDVKSIDISHFAAGVYMLRIMDLDGSVLHNERVVKLAD